MRIFRAKIESKPYQLRAEFIPLILEDTKPLTPYDELITTKTHGKKKDIVVQNATTVDREALVIFNICYPPTGKYKARRQQGPRTFRLLQQWN
ncbi:hypothetical protein EV44_g3334 [Erysiphe necator]|uniref:Uncharacterized protein n=1 Tax=Uncinula necator TaxID=52586 RepID=A0A0B1P365_UNCNE|nr:hypothetical protein EV44_g3334 [Erysiphe necator]